jgi:hypothetical protein
MRPGGGDFDGAFDMLLTFDLPKSSSCSADPVSDQLLVERTGAKEVSPLKKCTTSETSFRTANATRYCKWPR